MEYSKHELRHNKHVQLHKKNCYITPLPPRNAPPLGGGTLGISWWGCAAGTLVPLTFTRASAAEFCYPILE